MSTRTIRGYGPILLSSKRGNHRSKRYYWYKVELDNGRRTREILFVPPINPILNSGQAENDCDALSHQTAAVQRFSLKQTNLPSQTQTFDKRSSFAPLERNNAVTQNVYRVFRSIFGIITLGRGEKI